MVLDFIYLLLVAWGIYRGGRQGFVRYIFSSLAFIIGIIGALQLTHTFAHYLQQWFGWQSTYLPFFAFLAAFITIVLLVRLLANFLDKTLRFLYLNMFNRIAGAILGGLLFTVFCSMFIWLFNQIQLISPDMRANSMTYDWVAPVFPAVMDTAAALLPVFKDALQNLNELFEQWTIQNAQPTA
jgi:membrane protein required for colicin V production